MKVKLQGIYETQEAKKVKDLSCHHIKLLGERQNRSPLEREEI